MFKISTVDTRSKRTLVVEGTLIGPWVDELRTTWVGASQTPGDGVRFGEEETRIVECMPRNNMHALLAPREIRQEG